MSDNEASRKNIGEIEWRELNVKNAENICDFYCKVVGWDWEAVSMGEYDDFNLRLPAGGETVAGICHARGANSTLPGQWLMYVRVDDVQQSAVRCRALGGEIVDGPRIVGPVQLCVIQDPEGAVLALISDKQ